MGYYWSNIVVLAVAILLSVAVYFSGSVEAQAAREWTILSSVSSSTILGTKLYDVSVKTTLSCAARCASQPSCTYVTIDKSFMTCSLYVSSTSAVSVAGVTTYMVILQSQQIAVVTSTVGSVTTTSSILPTTSTSSAVTTTTTSSMVTTSETTAAANPITTVEQTTTSSPTTTTAQSILTTMMTTSLRATSFPTTVVPFEPITITSEVSMIFYGRATSAPNYFPIVLSFDGSTINSDSSSFSADVFACTSAAHQGLYWFLHTAVFDGTQLVNITLQFLDSTQSTVLSSMLIFSKNNTAYNGDDIISRNQILSISANDYLSMFTDYQLSYNTYGSGWGGFLLSGIMSPLVVFDVSCSQTISGIPVFDEVSYNYGNGWKSGSQLFVAPVDGYYYFSLTVGVAPSPATVWADLQESSGTHYCQVDLRNTHDGTDIVSRGCFLSLNAGNSVSIFWRQTGTDSFYSKTTFSGFLYSRLLGDGAAWSVHDNGAAGGSGIGDLYFPSVLFNQNFTWNATTGLGTVEIQGYYYMEIVAHTTVASQMDISVIHNSPTFSTTSTLARLYISYPASSLTRSLPFMAILCEGDTLSVQYSASQLDGGGLGGLSFQGFLISTIPWCMAMPP